jgi:hypothetical protein
MPTCYLWRKRKYYYPMLSIKLYFSYKYFDNPDEFRGTEMIRARLSLSRYISSRLESLLHIPHYYLRNISCINKIVVHQDSEELTKELGVGLQITWPLPAVSVTVDTGQLAASLQSQSISSVWSMRNVIIPAGRWVAPKVVSKLELCDLLITNTTTTWTLYIVVARPSDFPDIFLFMSQQSRSGQPIIC